MLLPHDWYIEGLRCALLDALKLAYPFFSNRRLQIVYEFIVGGNGYLDRYLYGYQNCCGCKGTLNRYKRTRVMLECICEGGYYSVKRRKFPFQITLQLPSIIFAKYSSILSLVPLDQHNSYSHSLIPLS